MVTNKSDKEKYVSKEFHEDDRGVEVDSLGK